MITGTSREQVQVAAAHLSCSIISVNHWSVSLQIVENVSHHRKISKEAIFELLEVCAVSENF